MTNENVENSPLSAEWMLKSCEEYKEDYKDCKSFRGRFNQYFQYGELLDCTQHKEDCRNCKLWNNRRDIKAYNALVESERKRRLERLAPHYKNDVWTKRDSPPEDWNKPLPEWMQNQHKDSYLYGKQKALAAGQPDDLDLKAPNCTIL